MRSSEELKELSVSEFTKAADKYESDHAGVYNLCKKDYPDISWKVSSSVRASGFMPSFGRHSRKYFNQLL